MPITENQQRVLSKLVSSGGTGNVMEFLGWPSAKFDEGFQFANDLQNLDMVKMLYSNFNKN